MSVLQAGEWMLLSVCSAAYGSGLVAVSVVMTAIAQPWAGGSPTVEDPPPVADADEDTGQDQDEGHGGDSPAPKPQPQTQPVKPKPTPQPNVSSKPEPPEGRPGQCTSLSWKPPSGAARSSVPSSAKREVQQIIESCVSGIADDEGTSTYVQVFFYADGAACGMTIGGHGAKDDRARTCMKNGVAGLSVPPMSGDYGSLELSIFVNN